MIGRPARPGARRSVGSRANAPRVPFALLVGGLLVGGLVLLLALNTGSAANELRRGALAGKDQEVSADLAQLRNEVAASAAPGNLAGAAQQLGMVPAANPAFIVELPDGRTVLRGHARPVSDDPLDIPTGAAHASPTPTMRAAAPTSTATSATSSTTKSATSSTTKSAPKTAVASNSSSTTATGGTAKSQAEKQAAKRAKKRAERRRHQAAHTATPTSSTPKSTPTGGHA